MFSLGLGWVLQFFGVFFTLFLFVGRGRLFVSLMFNLLSNMSGGKLVRGTYKKLRSGWMGRVHLP